jgi:hypothetical protein
MTIIILKRTGVDEMEPVARWADGEWIAGDLSIMDDPAYERYDEDLMLQEFNGPDLFATTEAAYQGGDDA